jgi:hypothetical protein
MACSSLCISTVQLIDATIVSRSSCEAAQEIGMEEVAELIPIKSGMIYVRSKVLTMVLQKLDFISSCFPIETLNMNFRSK